MDAERTQPEMRPKAPWWTRVFRRREPDPSIATVMAQWLEYELIFNDILKRLGAQLAREAKLEKRRLERSAPPPEARPAPPNTKAALRAQYAQARFGGRIQAIIDAKTSNGGQNESQNAQLPFPTPTDAESGEPPPGVR